MKFKEIGVATILSRRAAMRSAALALTGGALLTAGLAARPAVAAGVKMNRDDAGYQPMPKGSARCDGCQQWQAPHSCKVVDGVISPAGWCTLYGAKA